MLRASLLGQDSLTAGVLAAKAEAGPATVAPSSPHPLFFAVGIVCALGGLVTDIVLCVQHWQEVKTVLAPGVPAFLIAFLVEALVFGVIGTVVASLAAGHSEGADTSAARPYAEDVQSSTLGIVVRVVLAIVLVAILIGYPTAYAVLTVMNGEQPTLWLTLH
jgi:amino acid permease